MNNDQLIINRDQRSISVHISNAGEESIVKTHTNAYRNLMALLNNHLYLENFGECGGQGRCATCLVKISGSDLLRTPITGKEQSTLEKMQLSGTGIRLACQFLITEALDGCLIEIIEESY